MTSSKKMQKLIDYLEQHYQERITVAEMADYLYMGADNFYKFMVSLTGESPITFCQPFSAFKSGQSSSKHRNVDHGNIA